MNRSTTMTRNLKVRGEMRNVGQAINWLLAFGVICLLFAADSSAQSNATGQRPAAEIDKYMEAAAGSGLFMGAILVARDGKVLISKGYGMASLEYDVPNTSLSRFNIASVSKTFTATMILMLQDRGKLSVQDAICKYVDDCPDAWREITIHHLLTHSSGILNYTELPDQYELRALASFLPSAMNRIRTMPLQFKPGEKFSYSNTGYKLLHDIIVRVSGKSFEAFLQENILNPLRMRNTGVLVKPGIRQLVIKNRAAGYTDGVGPLENAPWVYPSYAGGVGIYSDVEDLNLWGESWLTDKLLSRRTRDSAFTPFRGNYGYGWFVFDKAKHRFVMHGGNIPGYGLTFAIYPDDRLIIVVASNLDTAPTSRIHDDLVKIVFGEKYELPPVWKTVAVNPKIYDSYVGRYQKIDDPNFVITITKENGQLWNRLGDSPGAATMVLRPLSETKYYNKMFVLYEATFMKNERGQVTSLVADGPWGRNEFRKIE
jgi:CubicO group peptidase (beta-lactamase class C family)